LDLRRAKLQDMNLSNLSANQLRQAAAIKEQIEQLQVELTGILGTTAAAPTVPAAVSQEPKTKGKMSPAAKAMLSAKLKAYWAKRKAVKQPATVVAQPQAKGKMGPAAKALLSAKLKAYWAKRKAAKK